MPDMQINRVTRHVLARYREFYPGSDGKDLLRAFAASEDIDEHIANRLAGRSWCVEGSSRYRLHSERTGLFVVAGTSLVTFIRLYSDRQRQLAVKLYGKRDAPPAEPSTIAEKNPGLLVLGITASRISVSRGLKSHLGDADSCRLFLAQAKMRTPTTADLESLRSRGAAPPWKLTRDTGRRVLLYKLDDGRVRAAIEPDEHRGKEAERAAIIPWLGIPMRSLRVSGKLLAMLYPDYTDAGAQTRGAIKWALRRCLLNQAPEILDETPTSKQILFMYDGEPVVAWVTCTREGDWWVIPVKPYEPDPAHLALGAILRAAGWRAEPPVWIDGVSSGALLPGD